MKLTTSSDRESRLSRRGFLSVASSSMLCAPRIGASGLTAEDIARRYDVSLFTLNDAIFHRWKGARNHSGGVAVWPSVSPDCRSLCWGAEYLPQSAKAHSEPTLTIATADGVHAIDFTGERLVSCALSTDAAVCIATTRSVANAAAGNLLVIWRDRTTGQFTVGRSADKFGAISSISGSGDLAAFQAGLQFRAVAVREGDVLFESTGIMPRVTPDGQSIAFIKEGNVYLRSISGAPAARFLAGPRFVGLGGYSPDGSFLLAGAWTRKLALEKSLVAIDMTKGTFSVLGNLREGDYGEKARWIANKLLIR